MFSVELHFSVLLMTQIMGSEWTWTKCPKFIICNEGKCKIRAKRELMVNGELIWCFYDWDIQVFPIEMLTAIVLPHYNHWIRWMLWINVFSRRWSTIAINLWSSVCGYFEIYFSVFLSMHNICAIMRCAFGHCTMNFHWKSNYNSFQKSNDFQSPILVSHINRHTRFMSATGNT